MPRMCTPLPYRSATISDGVKLPTSSRARLYCAVVSIMSSTCVFALVSRACGFAGCHLGVKIFHIERVLLDELAARFDMVAPSARKISSAAMASVIVILSNVRLLGSMGRFPQLVEFISHVL